MNQKPNPDPADTKSGSSHLPSRQLSLDMGSKALHDAIHQLSVAERDEQLTQITVSGSAGQHSALMRLDHPIRITMEGPLGDYAFAFNSQADIRTTGDVGHGVAEGMVSGAVRIRGDAGVGAGAAMMGGTLAIYGTVGNRCGAAMRSGGIFVRGHRRVRHADGQFAKGAHQPQTTW